MIETAHSLVGGDRELDVLDQLLREVRAGAPRFVVLSGEPGIGKTSLIAALGRRAAAAGCLALHGRATERELEVARLVVDRRTNPEIAAELFLSIKTVETHLRNIFAKAREHRLALADGRTLCYGLYGAGDGALVVVLDGPGSRGLGQAMASPAERFGVTLLVPDRPGFGGSTQSSNGSYAATADDMLAVVERAGVQRFGIVAQSGGTPYVLALASAAGNRATGLSFVGALAPLRNRDAVTDVTGPRVHR